MDDDIFIILMLLIIFALLCSGLVAVIWLFCLQKKVNKQEQLLKELAIELKSLNPLHYVHENVQKDVILSTEKTTPKTAVPSLLTQELEHSGKPGNLDKELQEKSNIIPGESKDSKDTPPTEALSQPGQKETGRQKVSQTSSNTIESFFLGNIFNKIGALAIIVSLGIFVKLAAPYFLFTDALKVTAGFIAGFTFLGLGAILHKKDSLRAFAEVVLGTGFALLFIITFCSCTIFDVFSTSTAMGITSVFLIAVYLTAVSMQRIWLLCLGLIGGYANVFFINPQISDSFLFAYLLLLNLLGLVGAYRCKAWIYLVNCNLAISLLIIISETSTFRWEITATTLAILWVMYAFYDILRSKNDILTFQQENLSTYINCGLLTLSCTWLIADKKETIALTLLLLSVSYAFAAYYVWMHQKRLVPSYVNLVFLTTLLGSALLFDGPVRVFVLALEGYSVAYLASRFRTAIVLRWVPVYITSSIISIFIIKRITTFGELPNVDIYTLSLSLYVFGVPILLSFLSSQLLKNTADSFYELVALEELNSQENLEGASSTEQSELINKGEISVLSAPDKPSTLQSLFQSYGNFLGLCSVTTLYFFVFSELSSIIENHYYVSYRTRELTQCLASTILASLYALQLSHTKKESGFAKVLSYIVGSSSVLFLLIISMMYSNVKLFPIVNIRALAYAMSIILMISYQKKTNNNFFNCLAVFLGFTFITTEATNIARLTDLASITTISWILYAAALIVPGMQKGKKYLTYSGILIVLISIFRVFVYDIANLPGIYKLFIFLIMGVTLMAISYLYTKWKENKKEQLDRTKS